MDKATPKNPPVIKISEGNLSLAVFKKTANEKTYFSGTLHKAFRNSSGEWRHTPSLDYSDFPLAARMFEEAYAEVQKLK